jgi:mono/diheme cytochrome c family protein
LFLLALALLLPAAPALAQEDTEILQTGAETYSAVCAACHQATGVGIPGAFPPLVGNPNVDDAAYVEQVIRNGREGELTVAGVTYNGVMPPRTGLSDEEISAVIAYLQAGLTVPGAPVEPAPSAGTAARDLPFAATAAFWLGFLLAGLLALLVVGGRIVATTDRLHLSWLDAWMKTAVIVAYLVVATVVIPSELVQSSLFLQMPGPARDTLASLVWLFGLVLGMVGLWILQREDRI